MADRKPLVFLANNRISELPSGDTLSWLWLSDVPVYASRWPTWDEVTDKPPIEVAVWGGITGTLADQTDLANALSGKINTGNAYEDAYTQAYPAATSGYNVDNLTEGNRVLANTAQHSGLPSGFSGVQMYAVETRLFSDTGVDKNLYQIARNVTPSGDGYGSVFVRTATANIGGTTWNPWTQIGGGATWGSITGNIYDQTDLVSEISDKADKDSVVNTTDNQTNIQGDKEWQGVHTFYGEGPRFLGAATNVTGPRPSFQLRTEADNRRMRIRYDATEAVDGPFLVQKYISGSWTTVLETDVSASELYIRGKRFWHDDNLNSGSLIPTCSPGTNVVTCSANTCQWVRVGDKVTYSGSVVISPAATGASCAVRISLPIPSTFANSLEVSGPATGKAAGVPSYEIGQITADPANNELELSFYPTSTNAHTMRFCVVYPIQ